MAVPGLKNHQPSYMNISLSNFYTVQHKFDPPVPRSCILVATPGFIFDAPDLSPPTFYGSSTQGSLELYQWTVDVPRIRNLICVYPLLNHGLWGVFITRGKGLWTTDD